MKSFQHCESEQRIHCASKVMTETNNLLWMYPDCFINGISGLVYAISCHAHMSGHPRIIFPCSYPNTHNQSVISFYRFHSYPFHHDDDELLWISTCKQPTLLSTLQKTEVVLKINMMVERMSVSMVFFIRCKVRLRVWNQEKNASSALEMLIIECSKVFSFGSPWKRKIFEPQNQNEGRRKYRNDFDYKKKSMNPMQDKCLWNEWQTTNLFIMSAWCLIQYERIW